MPTLTSIVATAILLGSAEAQAGQFGETAAVRLGAVVAQGSDFDRLNIAAALRPWAKLELEADLGTTRQGPAFGVRAGLFQPFRDAADWFQLDGKALAGCRWIEAFPSSRDGAQNSGRPGLPVAVLLPVPEAVAALDVTLWPSASGGYGWTANFFAGALVAPWEQNIGVRPEAGLSLGVAF